MSYIQKKERGLTKEAGKRFFWDTVLMHYESLFVFVLGLGLLTLIIWAEVEHDLLSYALGLKSNE